VPEVWNEHEVLSKKRVENTDRDATYRWVVNRSMSHWSLFNSSK